MKRLATILPFLFVLGIHAAAGETLNPQATVNGPMVRLGDLFAGVPKSIANRAVAPAPQPGRTEVFAAATLNQIAADAKIDWSPLSRFDRSIVTRASRTVTADDIQTALVKALRAQGLGKDMKVELNNHRLELNAATGTGAPFTFGPIRYDQEDGTAMATVLLADGDGTRRPVNLRANVYHVIQAPELARNLHHGQVVTRDDIVFADMRADALNPSIIVDPDSVVGMTPRSAVRAGQPLRRSDFVAPIVVAKGSVVIMTLTTPNLELTVKGRALQNGAQGETIRVKNTRSHVTVEGVVSGAGRVVVNLPSLALR